MSTGVAPHASRSARGCRGPGFDAHAGGLASVLEGVAAVAACLPYRLNLEVMEAALAAGAIRGPRGLYHVTIKQWELDPGFREAGLSAVMGIGSAPASRTSSRAWAPTDWTRVRSGRSTW